jgi:hypothetical protein
MQPEGWHHYRPPVAVVAGVVDVLHSGSDIDSAPNLCHELRFDDLLPSVVEPSIPEQETLLAIRQIHLAIFLDTVRHEGDSGTVLPRVGRGRSHTAAKDP